MVTRRAQVFVQNHTDVRQKFLVMHEYTGEFHDDSGWIEVDPGCRVYCMDARYNTGFLTTGRDNWKLEGRELLRAGVSIQGVPTGNVNAQGFVEMPTKSSANGVLANWKIHTLREEDEQQGVTFHVYPTLIKICSRSGVTETSFNYFHLGPDV